MPQSKSDKMVLHEEVLLDLDQFSLLKIFSGILIWLHSRKASSEHSISGMQKFLNNNILCMICFLLSHLSVGFFVCLCSGMWCFKELLCRVLVFFIGAFKWQNIVASFHIYTLPHRIIHPEAFSLFWTVSINLLKSYGHFWNFINRFIDTVRIFPFFLLNIRLLRFICITLSRFLNCFICSQNNILLADLYIIICCSALLKHLGGLHLFCKPLLISEEL